MRIDYSDKMGETSFRPLCAVLEHLEPHTLPDASMDSSARHPPPKCHPGTRVRIVTTLESWVNNDNRLWSMIWLHGPAGTGKSAVAQTFAEYCAERGRLGASYFFSRLNNRNKAEPVIPTLAYQLAVCLPEYKSILTIQLVNDPHLLQKAPPVQFRKLIIEPLSILQIQQCEQIRKPFVIILDGLDECEGEDAQREFIKMISEVVRLKKDFPLLWLICSRSEAHLKHTFSKIAECGREELVIDADCKDDVDRYLRDGFAAIQADYSEFTPSTWPFEGQLAEVLFAVSGLFIFGSTVLKYVSDPTYGNPVSRLNSLISFLKDADGVGTHNPLETLDLLYSRILSDIPGDVFPTTWRILAHSIHIPKLPERDWTRERLTSAQALCSFLRIDQSAFYGALRKLYSVVEVPIPAEAGKVPLRFYHASFGDFLADVNRSGKYVVDEQRARIDIAKACLFWHELDATLFHANDSESTNAAFYNVDLIRL